MAAKSKRIKEKLLWEAYTPKESDKDGYTDGKVFAEVVGNRKFHSFQVWREKKDAVPTYLYGVSLKQLEAICGERDREVERLSLQLEKINGRKTAKLALELKKINAENVDLRAALDQANALIVDLKNEALPADGSPNPALLLEEVSRLKGEKIKLENELKRFLKRQSNNDFNVNHSGRSVKPIYTPQGGSSQYKLRRQFR